MSSSDGNKLICKNQEGRIKQSKPLNESVLQGVQKLSQKCPILDKIG